MMLKKFGCTGVLLLTILLSANAFAQDGRIRVQLVSTQQTTLSSELSANISSLPLKEGESFAVSQQLAEFDCSILRAS